MIEISRRTDEAFVIPHQDDRIIVVVFGIGSIGVVFQIIILDKEKSNWVTDKTIDCKYKQVKIGDSLTLPDNTTLKVVSTSGTPGAGDGMAKIEVTSSSTFWKREDWLKITEETKRYFGQHHP